MSHAGLNDGTMVPYVVCILLLLSTVPTTREDSSKSAPEASEGSKIPECVTGDKYLDCSNINVELSRTSLVLYDGQKDGGALLRSILDIEKGSSFVLSVVTTSKSRGRGISSCPFSILRNPRHRRERGFSIGHRASDTELEVPPSAAFYHMYIHIYSRHP